MLRFASYLLSVSRIRLVIVNRKRERNTQRPFDLISDFEKNLHLWIVEFEEG